MDLVRALTILKDVALIIMIATLFIGIRDETKNRHIKFLLMVLFFTL
jgi:hypothetical protein